MTIGLPQEDLYDIFLKELFSAMESSAADIQATKNGESPTTASVIKMVEKEFPDAVEEAKKLANFASIIGTATTKTMEANNRAIEKQLASK